MSIVGVEINAFEIKAGTRLFEARLGLTLITLLRPGFTRFIRSRWKDKVGLTLQMPCARDRESLIVRTSSL